MCVCVNTATVAIQREGAKVQIHICEGASTYFNNNSSKTYFVCASAITGPTCICAKILFLKTFSCMYWFCVSGGVSFWEVCGIFPMSWLWLNENNAFQGTWALQICHPTLQKDITTKTKHVRLAEIRYSRTKKLHYPCKLWNQSESVQCNLNFG